MLRAKIKTCQLCGKTFEPKGTRERICYECKEKGCCLCGKPVACMIGDKPYCQTHYVKVKKTGTEKYSRTVQACSFNIAGDILTITTGSGETILADAEDIEILQKHPWSVKGNEYPSTSIDGRKVYMHRLVLGLQRGDGVVVDHINRNRRDNRKENLRMCSQMNNAWNAGVNKRNKLGVRGVSITKSGKYAVRICTNGKNHHIGAFDTLEEAKENRKIAERIFFGEFASYRNDEQ